MQILEKVPGSKLLIPINLETWEDLSPDLIDVTESLDILLLGYWQVPEQSSPEQVQKQHGEEARQRLKEVAAQFDLDEGSLNRRVVFTGKIGQTIEDVAGGEGCDAILTHRPIAKLDKILVVLREDISYKRLEDFLEDLIVDSKAAITLLFYADKEDHSEKELVLEGLKSRLDEETFEKFLIDYETIDASGLTKNIVDRSDDYDLLIIGRTSPKLLEKFVVRTDEKVAKVADKPVIVVRHDDEE